MVTFFYECLYIFTIVSGILAIAAGPTGVGKVGFLLFLAQIAVTSLFVIFKNGKTTGRFISIGILSAFTIFIIILSRYDEFLGLAIENVRLLWLLAFALAAFLLGELCAYVRVFGIVVSVLSFASLIPMMIFKFNVSKLYVAAVFLLVLLTLVSEFQRRWKKSGDKDLKKHMVFTSPFILLIIIVVLIMPYSPKPYNWTIVKNIYQTITETVRDIRIRASIRKNEDYAEAQMGFSDRGDITGEVKSSNETVLSVAGIPNETEVLKLRGKNFSTFNGQGWADEDISSSPDSMLDTIGIIASLADYDDRMRDYVRWEKMRIEYIQVNTSYIFAPEKVAIRKSNLPIYSFDVINSGSDIMWPKSKSYKTAYNIVYLLVNTENEDFQNFLKEGTTPTEYAYNGTLKAQFGLELDDEYSYENFIAHQQYIHDFYGKEVVLSDELKAYTKKLYEGCESDVEKLQRIEALLESFEYTETPGKIPDYIDSDTEFLDYFILESRKGYCSYFATAFTLLARAEGIPARYVQGYNIKTGSRNSVYVSSSMAHAWSEVYFDGAGWVSFDATPGYGGGTYWASAAKPSELPPIGTYERKETPTEESTLPELDEEEPEDEGIIIEWYMVAIPVTVGIAVIALFFLVFKITAAIRLNKMDYDRKFVVLCKQILTIFKLLGKPMNEAETIYEYKVRLSADYEDELLTFTDDLENYLYNPNGNEKGYKEACEKAFKIRDTLLEDLKKRSLVRFIRYHLVN